MRNVLGDAVRTEQSKFRNEVLEWFGSLSVLQRIAALTCDDKAWVQIVTFDSMGCCAAAALQQNCGGALASRRCCGAAAAPGGRRRRGDATMASRQRHSCATAALQRCCGSAAA